MNKEKEKEMGELYEKQADGTLKPVEASTKVAKILVDYQYLASKTDPTTAYGLLQLALKDAGFNQEHAFWK